MGLEIAHAASSVFDFQTTLLSGPGTLSPEPNSNLTQERFQSAQDLQEALIRLWPDHDILIMAAAVADFRPRLNEGKPEKIRRSDGPTTLHLDPVPDLLAELAHLDRPGQIRIGFALEPASELMDSAKRKLSEKRLAGIVANPLETLDSDSIDGTLLLSDGSTHRPPEGRVAKSRFAHWLLQELSGLAT